MVKHRFYDELVELERNPLPDHFHLLVVGTFNAEDGDERDNDALWFYGRAANEFWCFLPRMMDMPTLHQVDNDLSPQELMNTWKRFCEEHRILIVDVLKEVRRALPDHSDTYLKALSEGEFVLFDYETAFQHCTFDGVLFTWAESKGKSNVLLSAKNGMSSFFSTRCKYIMNMLTPSLAYSKPRSFKLRQWRQEYTQLKQKMNL